MSALTEKCEVYVSENQLQHTTNERARGVLAEAERIKRLKAPGINLAREAGLEALAESEEAEYRSLELRAWMMANGIEALSVYDYRVWREWLQKEYGTHSGYKYGFKDYLFHEGVPLDVRKLIVDLRHQDLFDWFEIRVPEPYEKDPALFGFFTGGSWYKADSEDTICVLLARWSESAEDLISFDKIKEIIDLRFNEFNENKFTYDERTAAMEKWREDNPGLAEYV